MKKLLIPLAIVPALFMLGCVPAAILNESQTVTLILKNGEVVAGRILDIWDGKIQFEPSSYWKASRYQRVIPANQVKLIELSDGTQMTVKEYATYRWGDRNRTSALAASSTKETEKPLSDPQYDRLKKKPIAKVTDNEFQYFMMMKGQELKKEQVREKKAQEATEQKLVAGQAEGPVNGDAKALSLPQLATAKTDSQKTTPVSPRLQLDLSAEKAIIAEASGLIVDSGLAGPLLQATRERMNRGEILTLNQLWLLKAVRETPKWKEREEEMRYLSSVAEQALGRAYLYTPDSLSQRLGLRFDPNAEMNFKDLVAQLHQHFGQGVSMGEFRALVEILGEGGARALREILRNYQDWRYAVQENPQATARKEF